MTVTEFGYTAEELVKIQATQLGIYGQLVDMIPNARGIYPSGIEGTMWWEKKLLYNPVKIPSDPDDIPKRCFLSNRVVNYLLLEPSVAHLDRGLYWPGDFIFGQDRVVLVSGSV